MYNYEFIETWDTYRTKSNGIGEKLLFCTTTEEAGPYYHKVKTEYHLKKLSKQKYQIIIFYGIEQEAETILKTKYFY